MQEACLNKNNSKKAYQLVQDLTSEKQGRSKLSKTKLGTVLQKNKRFSADGQIIAQSYTAMRVMVTIQVWMAVSIQTKICSQPFVRKLRSQYLHLIRENLQELKIYQQNLFKQEGSP